MDIGHQIWTQDFKEGLTGFRPQGELQQTLDTAESHPRPWTLGGVLSKWTQMCKMCLKVYVFGPSIIISWTLDLCVYFLT